MPVTLQNIKRAKDLGKKLRIAREGQGQNLAILASQCGLSVVKLVALESGNHYPFNNNIQEMLACAGNYARLLGFDILTQASANENSLLPDANESFTQVIPQFLIKKS
ncbi:MAG: hypothetical protein EBQ78_04445 [Betaproteobacteria bacterium]|nr:hypothetical protein [Betaproteobacteria bacterium]